MSDNKVTGHRPKNFEQKDESQRKLLRVQVPISKNDKVKMKRGFVDEVMVDPVKPLTEHGLRSLVKQASSDVQVVQLRAIKKVKALLSGRSPPVDQMINSEILPILIRCLGDHMNPTLQLEAARALTCITRCGTSLQTRAAVSAGAVMMLLNLLNLSKLELCQQAVCILVNITNECPELRDYFSSLNILSKLILFIKSSVSVTLLQEITKVIVNLCRCDDTPLTPHVTDELLTALKYLINNKHSSILVDTLLGIFFLSRGGPCQIQKILDSNILSTIISLLIHKTLDVKAKAVQAIGHIVCGTDEQTQVVLDAGLLSYFPALLSHSKKEIHMCAIWAISNVIAGNENQIQVVIDAGLIPEIITHLSKSEFQTQVEAVWAIYTLVGGGNSQQIQCVIGAGAVAPLCTLLSCHDTDVILLVLVSIKGMLEMAGPDIESLSDSIEEHGLAKIEQLQDHENIEIYKMAFNIILRFFN